MIPSLPPADQVPADINQYLVQHGWIQTYAHDKPYWQKAEAGYGYFTWEQAVAWSLVKPFLGN